ncbi:hypothetical protein B0H16DRAFT_1633750 [Mycena metata]|uniref:DUF6533 domain-containing protein n=1 Tax=Mycena metata TaxID=1033252 RepID=A0AAD7GX21_9AGAR|nr:hypothetical protein B0H16DRAFT_1633750 [Mycena metata]
MAYNTAYNPNYLQGSATAALTWVVYDVCLTLDREVRHSRSAVLILSWSLSKVLFLFSRYHTILSLGFFLMECIGTKHLLLFLVLNFNEKAPPAAVNHLFTRCTNRAPSSNAARWYIGLAEVFSILAGELLILIRINTVYGWGRKIVTLTLFLFCGTIIGLGTTVISLLGGSKGLFGSTNILICGPDRANVPDVNIASTITSMAVACVYFGLVIHKALNVLQDIETADGRPKAHKVSLITYFKASRVTLPIFHLCLRDAGTWYFAGEKVVKLTMSHSGVFLVLLVNLLLVVSHNRFAQLGSAWLLATYSVAV